MFQTPKNLIILTERRIDLWLCFKGETKENGKHKLTWCCISCVELTLVGTLDELQRFADFVRCKPKIGKNAKISSNQSVVRHSEYSFSVFSQPGVSEINMHYMNQSEAKRIAKDIRTYINQHKPAAVPAEVKTRPAERVIAVGDFVVGVLRDSTGKTTYKMQWSCASHSPLNLLGTKEELLKAAELFEQPFKPNMEIVMFSDLQGLVSGNDSVYLFTDQSRIPPLTTFSHHYMRRECPKALAEDIREYFAAIDQPAKQTLTPKPTNPRAKRAAFGFTFH